MVSAALLSGIEIADSFQCSGSFEFVPEDLEISLKGTGSDVDLVSSSSLCSSLEKQSLVSPHACPARPSGLRA